MRIRILLLLLLVALLALFCNVKFGHADCGPYGCLEPYTTCVLGVCVSTKPPVTPDPTPTPVTPVPSTGGIPDSALYLIQKMYCKDNLCVVVVQPASVLNAPATK